MIHFYWRLFSCIVERKTLKEIGLTQQLRAGNTLIDLVTVDISSGK